MAALYPAFEVTLPAADDFNGRSLSHTLQELDELAASSALVALSGFIDARTMALEVLDEDQLPASCPPMQWYPAQEGLATVQGLLSFLEQYPERMPQQRVAVIADLDQLAVLLQEAQKQDVGFHLLVDL